MKKTLALYKTEYCDYIALTAVLDINGAIVERKAEYARLTEYIEVEFTELPQDIFVNNQVVAIDKIIEEIKSDAMKKVGDLQQKRQELLALTHDIGE